MKLMRFYIKFVLKEYYPYGEERGVYGYGETQCGHPEGSQETLLLRTTKIGPPSGILEVKTNVKSKYGTPEIRFE